MRLVLGFQVGIFQIFKKKKDFNRLKSAKDDEEGLEYFDLVKNDKKSDGFEKGELV